jgi:predicted permease
MTPPGTRLRAIAARLLDARTVEYLVEPAVADMQAEYEDAARKGLGWRKRWICLRGYLSFCAMLVAHARVARAVRGGLTPLRGLSLDVRLALRLLVKHAGLTVVATVAMGFAIWSGIVAFEFYTQFMRPTLPLDGGARIVGLVLVDTATPGERSPTRQDFETWRDGLTTVQDLAAYRDRNWNVIVGDAAPEPVAVAEVTAATFRVVRERPILGRPLIEEDEKPDAPAVVVIGYDVWRSRFASDPQIIGRELRVANVPHTIVGVMPAGFRFPVAHDFWVPLRLDAASDARRQDPLRVFGRLAAGATLDTAQPELAVLGARAAAAFPDTHAHLEPRVVPYIDSIFGSFSDDSTTEVFMGNLLSVLLVCLVCGNVALLMFARAATREKEMLVRAAIGAGRGRLMGQLFVEALVLALLAAVVAVTCAQLAWHALFAMVMENVFDNRVPFWIHSSVSPRTLLYAAVLTFVAATIAGLLPGLKVTRGLGTRLRQSAPGGGGALRFGGVWTVLIVMQVAVMAIVPTPVIATHRDMGRWARAANAGLTPERYLSATMAMDRETVSGAAGAALPATFPGAIQELERRLESEPGVTGVTVASVLPLMAHPIRQIDIDERGAAPADGVATLRRVSTASVALDFFEVLDAPIVAGRAFHSADLLPEARTVIVNQSFAQVVFGGSNPVGRRLRFRVASQQNAANAAQPWYQVVGVVADFGIARDERDAMKARVYQPMAPGGSYPVRMAIHTAADPLLFASRLRSIARDVDPTLQITEIARFDQVAEAGARTMTLLFWGFFALALVVVLLSLTGIYTVLSFIASQRTREVGIRVALGGQRRHVIAALFRRPLMQIGLGIVIGLILADRLSEGEMVRVIALYGCVVTAIAVLATLIPVRRALRIEPLDALRTE